MKYSFLFFLLSFTTVQIASAQSYTDVLQNKQGGRGSIIINQDADIEKIVNGEMPIKVPGKSTEKTMGKSSGEKSETHDSAILHKRHYTGERVRHKAQGFRICIYTGGNSRNDKNKANQMAERCKKLFGELSVYPFFEPPRWVCHVGDFKTREEAQKYVERIRHARFTYETRIVKSEVNLVD